MDNGYNITAEEQALIQSEFAALINDYLNSNHRRKVDIINKAFALANEAHKGVRRRSGEPYILHPIAVARIISKEIGLGSTSICAALLHDVVEDTDYTVDDLRSMFGDKIAAIVDGVTKIPSGMFGDNVSSQAENFRKLLLTMSDDIRVILVKIADRLHNMRTLGSMLPAKRYKIAGETMYIYAPLAHRLGLFAIKTELEELSFKYENPDAYNHIIHKLEESNIHRSRIYENFATPVVERLNRLNISYDMKAREKSIYSIWNKMQKKNVAFEEIYDLFAVRIIFDAPEAEEKARCWDIYTAITELYELRPDRIRDWISRPKMNGYQALHVTVMGPDGQWIEVQIRSRRMNEIAEKGLAAHWKYKTDRTGADKTETDNELEKWLGTIREILENPNPNALDFLDTVKMNLFALEIFIFTPKGDMRILPQGATALDFAYDLHSNIGDCALGAKVNHRLVSLNHKLRSGDQVEIITSRTPRPNAEWLKIVTTAKARTRIENALRRIRREMIRSGEQLFYQYFSQISVEPSNSLIDQIIDYYQFGKRDELFFAIGNKDILLPKDPNDLLHIKYRKRQNAELNKQEKKKVNQKETFLLKEENFRKNFAVAPCCNPIPGETVLGYMDEAGEVTIHNVDCEVAQKLKVSFGNRIVSTEWGNYHQYTFSSTLIIKGIDKMGMIQDIATAITADGINIKSFAIESTDGVFEGRISLHVHSVEDVNKVSQKIQDIDGVKSVHKLST